MWKRFIYLLGTLLVCLSGQAQLDSATIAPSQQYSGTFMITRALMGRNYRNTWKTPVRLPVLRLSETAFRVESLGGGQQTKSLRLVDEKGEKWVLRSVDKDVRAGIPRLLHSTPVLTFKQDLISADHPFGAAVAASLLKEAGIAAPDPIYFFVADDPGLGPHAPFFAGTIAMLEKYAPTPDRSPGIATDTVKRLMEKRGGSVVMQKDLLRTRLIDMLIGDWDRHEGNWLWGAKDSAGLRYFYAIPRDRDHSLYRHTGMVPALVTKLALPFMDGFKKEPIRFTLLNAKGWNLDRYFLNGLDSAQWQSITTELLQQLNDGALQRAVDRLPLTLNGDRAVIRETLAARRQALATGAMEYYRFLAKEVTLRGSAQKELIRLSQEGDKLVVSMHAYNNNVAGALLYRRSFDPKETNEINIHPNGGEDVIVMEQEKLPVRVRLFETQRALSGAK